MGPSAYGGVVTETSLARTRRARRINRLLTERYPGARCELDFTTPLELLVATVLSAQTTDVRVNTVTPELFTTYLDAAAYAGANRVQLEEIIRPAGFFRAKTQSLMGLGQALVDRFDGVVPRAIDDLVTLPGVWRKTANVVLGNAFGINVGVVVDTHVTRLSNRLGLVKGTDAVKLEQELIKLVPQPQWALFSHWLIWHGRRRCAARQPDCANCEIKNFCPQIGMKQ